MARPAHLARASSESLRSIQSTISTVATVTPPTKPSLHPCAASSSLFLFGQGPSVVCVRHDSLELERRFERHADNVTLIAVDNSSQEGSARVVSIDASREAIVWDASDGEELARFQPFEEIRVAAWMRNGHLACGDCKGNVILFDPSQNESILAHTTSNSLCALAPSADCKTFALGYNNGSILVASLLPFTILYTLHTPSLPPSPIASLAWHASSSRQKADMLATQTRDGDLRVWSVSKAIESGEPPKVVRVLARPEGNRKGNNYCAWSMKGRVVQFTEGLAAIYDVRNKEVTSHPVETPPGVAGITVFATKGVLFTVGEDFTVQQYDLYPPSVKNSVQHLPTVPPPSPPVSIEERADGSSKDSFQDHRDHVIERFDPPTDDYHLATMSPLGRIAHELEQLERMEANGLGMRTGPEGSQRANSISSRSAAMSRRPSTASTHSNRSISSVSSFASSQSTTSERSTTSDYSESNNATPIARVARNNSLGPGQPLPPQPLSARRIHPLAQQIISSPIDQPQPAAVFDLFSNVRARLPFVTYETPRQSGKLNEDDLRREMLFAIFGWKGDVDSLIRDELDSVDSRSLNAVMLRMWLGDLDQNSLSVLLGSDFSVSGDWLFVALSAMDGKKSWETVARAFVMRLVQKGDIHTAAVVLLALASPKDAVDLYVSHNMFL
ncbi:WD40-repeat-containing domain protein [Peziza echinospora]|nr:WD40-repeat-containing domain protein [Peziza echinospora]